MDFCAAMISASSSGRAFVIQAVVCVLVVCQIWPNMQNMHIWVLIWARQIWSSGVSLKRSCKKQFRRVGLRSIGPSSPKLCNYNVKLKMACGLWVYNAEFFSGGSSNL